MVIHYGIIFYLLKAVPRVTHYISRETFVSVLLS